ncbi:MAG: hypothetical protein ABH883_08005 [Candidatus Omnitrophota bacterium]
MKISELLNYLNTEYGARMINLEGGKGKYGLAQFTDIRDRQVRRDVSGYFAGRGIVSGAEYFAVNNTGRVTLWGVEDEDLYVKNLTSYTGLLPVKDRVDASLKVLEKYINKLKENIFSKDLLEIDIKRRNFESGKTGVKSYLRCLARKAARKKVDLRAYVNIHALYRCMENEKKIDFKKAEEERSAVMDKIFRILSKKEIRELTARISAFRNGELSDREFYSYFKKKIKETAVRRREYAELARFIKYTEAYEAVDNAALTDELGRLENEIKKTLFTDNAGRELDALARKRDILEGMFDLRLREKEYEYYVENEAEFKIPEFISFIEKQASRYNIETVFSPDIYALDTLRTRAARFYGYSRERDRAFIENMRFDGAGTEGRPVILIAGGFHSGNLADLFRKNNISYVSIAPAFKDGRESENHYYSLLSGKGLSEERKIMGLLYSNLAVLSFLNESEVYKKLPEGEKLHIARQVYVEWKIQKEEALAGLTGKKGIIIKDGYGTSGIDWSLNPVPRALLDDLSGRESSADYAEVCIEPLKDLREESRPDSYRPEKALKTEELLPAGVKACLKGILSGSALSVSCWALYLYFSGFSHAHAVLRSLGITLVSAAFASGVDQGSKALVSKLLPLKFKKYDHENGDKPGYEMYDGSAREIPLIPGFLSIAHTFHGIDRKKQDYADLHLTARHMALILLLLPLLFGYVFPAHNISMPLLAGLSAGAMISSLVCRSAYNGGTDIFKISLGAMGNIYFNVSDIIMCVCAPFILIFIIIPDLVLEYFKVFMKQKNTASGDEKGGANRRVFFGMTDKPCPDGEYTPETGKKTARAEDNETDRLETEYGDALRKALSLLREGRKIDEETMGGYYGRWMDFLSEIYLSDQKEFKAITGFFKKNHKPENIMSSCRYNTGDKRVFYLSGVRFDFPDGPGSCGIVFLRQSAEACRAEIDEIKSVLKEKNVIKRKKTGRGFNLAPGVEGANIERGVFRELIEHRNRFSGIISGDLRPARRPVADNSPDPERIKELVARYPPRSRELADFLFGCVMGAYISQGEFEKALTGSLLRFKTACREPYVIFIPGGKSKSNYWVYCLASEEKMLRPEAVFIDNKEDELSAEERLDKWMAENPRVKNIVYLDDASYSGSQASESLEYLVSGFEENRGISVHMVIPYVTSSASREIACNEKITSKCRVLFYNAYSRETKTVREFFTELKENDLPRYQRLWPLFLDVYGLSESSAEIDKALFYFDHKRADGVSVFNGYKKDDRPDSPFAVLFSILDGPVIDERGIWTGDFAIMPPMTACYKEEYETFIEINVKDTMWEGRISGENSFGKCPARRAAVDNAIDRDRLESLISAYPEKYRSVAELLFRAVAYVSQDEFEAGLSVCVEEFRRKCPSPFSMLIFGDESRSSFWTYQIALEKGLPRPRGTAFAKMDFTGEIGEFFAAWVKGKCETEDLVYIDDASFSGTQVFSCLNMMLEDLNGQRRVRLHIIIPYMTSTSKNRIMELKEKYAGKDVTIEVYSVDTEKVKTAGDIFRGLRDQDAEKYRRLWPLFVKLCGEGSADKALFYFQHKTADVWSIVSLLYDNLYTSILDGPLIDENGRVTEKRRFMPPIDAPYHRGYDDFVRREIAETEWAGRILEGDRSRIFSSFPTAKKGGNPDEEKKITGEICETIEKDGFLILGRGNRGGKPLAVKILGEAGKTDFPETFSEFFKLKSDKLARQNTLTDNEEKAVIRISDLIHKISRVVLIDGHAEISGYLRDDENSPGKKILYITRFFQDNPLSVFYLLAAGISENTGADLSHSSLRGAGHDAREALKKALNGPEFSGCIKDGKFDPYIAAEKTGARGFTEILNKYMVTRPLSPEEKARIRYNFDTLALRDETISRSIGAEIFLYGIQDHIDPARNAEFSSGIRYMRDGLRRGCVNMHLIPAYNPPARQGQYKYARKTVKSLKGTGIDSIVTHYGDGRDIIFQLDKLAGLALSEKYRKKFPKININCVTDTDLLMVKQYLGQNPGLAGIAVITDLREDVPRGMPLTEFKINEGRAIELGNYILNDKRLRDDFHLAADNSLLVSVRKEFIRFCDDLEIIDIREYEISDIKDATFEQLEKIMRKLYKGSIPLSITKINWSELHNWKVSQEEFVCSL